jgi:hypothetical protein
MLSTIDSSEDDSILMKGVTGNLSTVAKLKDTLANLCCSSVYFVEEEDNTHIAGSVEPFRSQPLSNLTFDFGKAKQVTLGHLGGSALHDRKVKIFSNLIDQSAFPDTVATTEKNRITSIEDERDDRVECCKINSHD